MPIEARSSFQSHGGSDSSIRDQCPGSGLSVEEAVGLCPVEATIMSLKNQFHKRILCAFLGRVTFKPDSDPPGASMSSSISFNYSLSASITELAAMNLDTKTNKQAKFMLQKV